MGLDVINQPILILRKAEEIALLAGLFHRATAVRAAAVLELKLRPEGFAWGAVPALVFALIDIALIVQFAENLLHRLHMAFIRRADEVAIVDIHQLPELFDAIYDVIHVFLRGHASLARLALDLLAMLIRAGQEEHIVARHLLESSHRVRRSRTIAMADMQIIARIINRRCDVERRFFAHPHLSLKKRPPHARGAIAYAINPGQGPHQSQSHGGITYSLYGKKADLSSKNHISDRYRCQTMRATLPLASR